MHEAEFENEVNVKYENAINRKKLVIPIHLGRPPQIQLIHDAH